MPDSDDACDRLIGDDERRRLVGFSRSHCWRLERDGKFPRRVYLGPRTVRWKLSEVLAWIAALQGGEPEMARKATPAPKVFIEAERARARKRARFQQQQDALSVE